MITLITYDITSPKRLRRTNKFLKEFGINTQKSVFECDIDNNGLKTIRRYCKKFLDINTDSVRIYKICSGCINKVLISGQGIKIINHIYQVI
ncbi:MAG: CRISPR-associated endonuclease Cas2 [Desulfobacula sp.]|nr:CRISPR-associated endonuclease Cas2 [Desulfobacula sp.]